MNEHDEAAALIFSGVVGKALLAREAALRGAARPGQACLRTRGLERPLGGAAGPVTPPPGLVTWSLAGPESVGPAPSPASSAAAVGMETSAPRAELAATAMRHSGSSRSDPLPASSRDELAEMAASSLLCQARSRAWLRPQRPGLLSPVQLARLPVPPRPRKPGDIPSPCSEAPQPRGTSVLFRLEVRVRRLAAVMLCARRLPSAFWLKEGPLSRNLQRGTSSTCCSPYSQCLARIESGNFESLDLAEFAKKQPWWRKLFGQESGPSAEKYSVATQLLIGGVTGWCTGFIFQKVGKLAATAVGGGFFLLQLANHTGYIKVDWQRVEKDMKKAKEQLKIRNSNQISTEVKSKAEEVVSFVKKNVLVTGGFCGGFLLGMAS
ncbi:PREDICTED: FUN14 domain-containing protein 2 [Galeopterus variegatus]|uniref:FUN14 domain-containing protein 2 n=1 Tax=Galeopterus variegatus TaxID=482537 RepID=A0ABM0RZX7_GALVR|nr:PREDICTED: FUN14 domain-containing protein 2 [Galeopterus variegatus]